MKSSRCKEKKEIHYSIKNETRLIRLSTGLPEGTKFGEAIALEKAKKFENLLKILNVTKFKNHG